MGSGRKPGPVCSSNADGSIIDAGTNCLAKSPEPGSIGVNAADDVAAAKAADALMRKNEKRPKSNDLTQLLIGEDIKIIAASPLGQTDEGRQIVALLTRLNKNHDIVYDDTAGARGDWDGNTIRINPQYDAKAYPTAIELVHEATHALWRSKHKSKKKVSPEEERERSIDDELHAQENQLNMYRHFRDTNKYENWQMDLRLERLDNGSLRAGIEEGFVKH
jgi:hypothetical protein